MNPVTYAIPAFFVLIFIEVIATVIRKKDYYRLNDAINSLSCGVLNITTKLVINLGIYTLVYEHLSVFELGVQALWVWVIAFVMQDFLYYWNHRIGHEVNLFWASHAVHHQSEEYNLTTALRQTSTSFFLAWIFYVPMAILGFPPEVFAAVSLANLLYQFWVHTRHIPKLGWYEWFFVTPSNHRVHHAKNLKYLDKNYGGVFILWDRLFQTYQEEDDNYEPIRYGTIKPLRSWNPLWANLSPFADLMSDTLKTSSWKDKFALWFKHTGYRPADVALPAEMPDIHAYENYDPETHPVIKVYAGIQFALLLVATTILVGISHTTTYNFDLLWASVLIVNLICLGKLLDNSSPIQTETWRFAIVLAAVAVTHWQWQNIPPLLTTFTLAWMLLSLVILKLSSHQTATLKSESQTV